MSTYLMHYGVKGMRWGVRHDKPSKGNKYMTASGQLTEKGKKKYKTVTNYNNEYRYDRIKKGLLIAAGVSAAAVVGTMAWKYGVTYGDKVLKAGTLVQNIAPQDRGFDTSFYGAINQKDRQFFLKKFTSDPKQWGTRARNKATILTNEADIKIAGRRTMDKAYREMVGKRTSYGTKTKYYQSFGGLDEADRQKFISVLEKKGYNGFKDVNDILINWADTPTVFFGKNSGLKIRNQSTVNVARAKQFKVSSSAGKRATLGMAASMAMEASLLASTYPDMYKTRNTTSYNRFGKQYKDLTRAQKGKVNSIMNNYAYKKGDKGSVEIRQRERRAKVKSYIKSKTKKG